MTVVLQKLPTAVGGNTSLKTAQAKEFLDRHHFKGDISKFEPMLSKPKIAALEEAKAIAKRMEDWDAGWKAANDIFDEIVALCAWWLVNVTPSKGWTGHTQIANAQSEISIADAATKITGYSPSKISRWNKSLEEQNRQAFLTTIFEGGHKVAMHKVIEAREAGEQARKDDLEREVDTELVEGLHHGDFRELSHILADNSVQLVFTDPPYDKDSTELYGAAARIAARVLKPGGSFIAYSGQSQLPGVLNACGEHLRYWWTIANVHAGGNQILNKLGIRCGWKPLVWFVKETRGDVKNVLIDTISGAREKGTHEWQQAESEARYYIEKLTSADGLVVDFFLGGGTTAVAAKSLGRPFTGFEISAESIEKASERIANVGSQRKN